jgi:hypothetical protein
MKPRSLLRCAASDFCSRTRTSKRCMSSSHATAQFCHGHTMMFPTSVFACTTIIRHHSRHTGKQQTSHLSLLFVYPISVFFTFLDSYPTFPSSTSRSLSLSVCFCLSVSPSPLLSCYALFISCFCMRTSNRNHHHHPSFFHSQSPSLALPLSLALSRALSSFCP